MYHTLDICHAIAEKLKNPYAVRDTMTDRMNRGLFYSQQWSEFSFAWGIPGIICFYAMMHLQFENEGWDNIAHQYLVCSKEYLESSSYLNTSLFLGLTGFCYAAYLCSEKGSRYQKMLAHLDDLLMKEVSHSFINKTQFYAEPTQLVPPDFYNLANGLSGVITYLIARDHQPNLTEFAHACVESLVNVLSVDREIGSQVNPAWYQVFDYDERNKQAGYHLNVPYGLPGVLATLSLAAKKGMRVKGLIELISKMAEWIKGKHIIDKNRVNWNEIISVESDSVEQEKGAVYQDVWSYGAPGISRCLYLASQALKNPDLAIFSENVCISHLEIPPEELLTPDTSFSFGKAGLLKIAHQMACDTQKPNFFHASKALENSLKDFYHPNYEFGFQAFSYRKDQSPQWVDNPGLLNGAAGIGLALLETQSHQEMFWSRAFAIV